MMTLESIEETTTGEGFSADELDRIAEQFDPPSQALTEMVRRVANELELDVCSIYILEKDRQHLCLAATMGLNQSSVGHVRMKICEGLAGLVAEQMQTVSVAAASQHPRFKYFPEAGEEKYSSFHGLALIDDGRLQGVLVVQTIEAREYSASEVALVSEFAQAIAPIVRKCRLVEFFDT
ncbi:MAG: GAF domain-containing protein [Planctomycetaceae bacterium]|jgi:signal transduction protein with GAF and PtsI domain|nr:GAF domain-containing protein [Planctomycetaceae bacterium]